MLSNDTLQRLGELAEKATPGEWRSSREDMTSYISDETGGLQPVAYVYRKPEPRIQVLGERYRDDSRFIAAANPSVIAALVAELAAARAVVEATRSFLMSNSVSAVVMLDPLLAYDAALAHHHQTPEAG